MPSLASAFFRLFMRLSSGRMLRAGGSIPEWRAQIEKATRLMKPPSFLKVTPVDAGGVPAEWDIPDGAAQDRAILYIHGGAWVICSPRTHRGMVGRLARAAGMPALSIDYRMAPEHPFPAAVEDCLAAYRWLLAQGHSPHKLAIAGDSAGGNLTLATLLALRDAGEPLPAAAACLSPATDLLGTGASMKTRRKQELLLRGLAASEENPGIAPVYAAGHDLRDPLLSPLYGDLHGLPPLLVHVGDYEILLDDSTRFVEKARAAGVDARLVVWPAMWHVFQFNAPFVPEARQSLEQLGGFIREKLA